ncbi:uncharacterized protein [Epargyreus clarus]|uniref:uncharacterized protein isoform X2 n=1 Tax=Epargyreus clarus TaxID=520877 RepID=UPI003C2AB30A
MNLCKAVRCSNFRLLNLRSQTTLYRIPPQLISRLSTNASIPELRRQKETFHDVLPRILDSIVTSPKFNDVEDVASWIRQVLDYNLAGGKLARGLSTVMAYEILEKPDKITDETLQLSRIMGWCVEMLQAYLLVLDDIMDASLKRRGMPCWYTLPNVGLGAINDSILIYTSMIHVLRSHFGHLPQYFDIMDQFNEALLFTSVGQHLDYTMGQRNKNDYSLFTVERYNAIVKYKTSYYTYKLPVCLGMLLSNNNNKESHRKAEQISFKIGRIFQMQDDFIDGFGSESVTGKTGRDIQEGKCSWLAVTALQLCNEPQRKVFTSCYGSSEPAHIERIKRLYEELNLPEVFRQEERTRYDEVVTLANKFGDGTRAPELFLKLLDAIYNRNK